MKPLIAMTTRSRVPDPEKPELRQFFDNESYFRFVEAGGGIPVLLSALSEEDAAEAAERFDGLLITGGEDVDPERYGEENIYSFTIDADLEDADIYLYRAFRKAGKPILGICRGMQIIAVAEGTGLVQDIPAEYGTEHSQALTLPPLPIYQPLHDVSFVKGSRLYDIFGDSYGVNSFHHQCLKDVPSGFSLAAVAPEGFPEAIETEHVTAVQWHPERMVNDPRHKKIIDTFVSECASVSAR